jgi:hypothetical protein
MRIHNPSTHHDCLDMDLAELWNNHVRQFTLCDVPQDAGNGHGYCSIKHIVASYDAGDYGYQT